MARSRTTTAEADPVFVAITSYSTRTEDGAVIDIHEGMRLRGAIPAKHPQFWARDADAADAAEARLKLYEQTHSAPVQPVYQRNVARVRAIRSFREATGEAVLAGELYDADHPLVVATPEAFEPVE